MKKIVLFTSLLLTNLLSSKTYAQSMADIDERLTDIELKIFDRKIDTNFEMQMLGGYLKNNNSFGENSKDYNTKVFKNNIRLKLHGKLNDDFDAYLSFQVSHTFNDELQTGVAQNNNITIATRGSSPYLRTAYFDWQLASKLVMSAGRLPTTFGPPEHIKVGRKRMGTYPQTSFNMPLDGVSFTHYTFSNFDSDLIARAIYLPGTNSDSEAPHIANLFSTNNPGEAAKGHEAYTAMIEYNRTRPTSFFQKSNTIFQFSRVKLASFLEQTTPLDLTSKSTGNPDKNIYRIYADNAVLSDISIVSFYQEFSSLFNSRFDFYYSYMNSDNNPKAKIKAQVISDTNSTTPVIDLGNFLSNGDSHGSRSMYGLKYNFEESFLGFEYWKSTSSALPNDLYSDDIIALGQISGESYHTYYTHLFYNKNLTVRTGLVKINSDKSFQRFAYVYDSEKIYLGYTSLFVNF